MGSPWRGDFKLRGAPWGSRAADGSRWPFAGRAVGAGAPSGDRGVLFAVEFSEIVNVTGTPELTVDTVGAVLFADVLAARLNYPFSPDCRSGRQRFPGRPVAFPS